MIPNLTPQCFIEILLLGIYWEHGERKPHRPRKGRITSEREWTTVDHVRKVLLGVGAITEITIKMIQHHTEGKEYQRKLYHHCGVIYSGAHVMTDAHSWFLCRQWRKSGSIVPYESLVRDLPIQILDTGVQRVSFFERLHGENLLKKDYLKEAYRIHALEKVAATEKELG